MNQIQFTSRDFRRFEMVGNSTDAIGITHNDWRGKIIEPLISGAILLTYSVDGWAARELLESLGIGKYKEYFEPLSSDANCAINATNFKLGRMLTSIYVTNIDLIHDGRKFYLGSVASKDLDDLIYKIRETLAGRFKPADSTEAAIGSG